jgi:dienelactone hydrolase
VKSQLALSFLLMLASVALSVAEEAPNAADHFANLREQASELGQLTDPPAVHEAAGFVADGPIKPIFYEALPWKGKPTRVFAWLGIPKERTGKVPGIVLVHGGGGTAFKEWVAKWNAHGFAAISIAVEGQTDQTKPDGKRGNRWKSHQWAGPTRVGIFADSDQPLEDQWIYHAVADTVLANSLLRSLPEVNADKVGLMGISWGGVVTSTAIGIDDRFAFAIPTYGCGHLFDADNQWGRALGGNQTYRQVWDPMMWLDRVNTPLLWLSWPKDSHFPLDCQAACYRAMPGPRMVALVSGMGHSHPAGWNPPDSYAFAKCIAETGEPWIQQVASEQDGATVHVEFSPAKPLDRAILVWTPDEGFTGNRTWKESPATLETRGQNTVASASLPTDARAWFVNVYSNGLTASSEFMEIPAVE